MLLANILVSLDINQNLTTANTDVMNECLQKGV